ncbi:hypothetical protein WH47_04234 [Habropoda laboriosa]|uniref:Uncharacterized protein n=1 Tax=Habropoda laboriosa TaxID=597456 RepID=A0A0L7QVA7_9HYME|nr:hypothetical protein WH47_04234 [Habropoda laboriosa]
MFTTNDGCSVTGDHRTKMRAKEYIGEQSDNQIFGGEVNVEHRKRGDMNIFYFTFMGL